MKMNTSPQNDALDHRSRNRPQGIFRLLTEGSRTLKSGKAKDDEDDTHQHPARRHARERQLRRINGEALMLPDQNAQYQNRKKRGSSKASIVLAES